MNQQKSDIENIPAKPDEQQFSSSPDDEQISQPNPPKISGFPKRYVLLLMIFIGFVNIYAMRVNLNVALVAMVNNQTIIKGGVNIIKQAEFDWNSKLQGLVLGSFFYGYWVLQIPGAWVALKIGGTRVFGYGVLLTSLLAIITPIAARYHVMALIGVRIFQGCPFGNIVAIPLTGVLSKYGFDGGWPSVFYCIETEKNFIETSISGSDDKAEFESLPWSDILKSPPVWAIVLGHFGACWGYYTLFTGMPTYFKDVLDFDIEQTGFLAACPYLFKAILGPVGGITADMLIRYKICRIGTVRKTFYGAGCLLAGIFIVATGYTQQRRTSVIFLVLGVGFSGLNAIGYAVNHLDIAPPFAGVLMGLTNTFASTPGFISPQITGFVTSNKTQEDWRIVFWITLIIYVIAVIFYTWLCSGERQPWASPTTQEDIDKEE
ncbi:Vesicular glutamate transporter 1 [Stylophora pistillata]|uniref:Vesicular glutamate transporter 1 n=1 Tax=Stylophora pistillata TaxID=50429 RepID=A0A2B4RVE1_STYPI|nr:Vesicular glutamate transporter 1 [Stylophora pistillata]